MVIAGDEPEYYKGYRKYLVKLTKKLEIETNVLFLGKIRSEDTPALFHKASVVVFPYVNTFSASGSLALAMQHCKPVLVPKAEFFKEILVDGIDAIFFMPKDHESLAKALTKSLLDKNFLLKISENLRVKKRNFSWNNTAEMTLKIYEVLVSTSSSTLP